MGIRDEFISQERKPALFTIGGTWASALAGFLAGLMVILIFGLLIWYGLSLQ